MGRILILCVCVASVFGFNFNIMGVEQINGTKDSYFGYALLLQKGTKDYGPRIIVGAPRKTSDDSGGSVYSCFKGHCAKYNIAASNAHSKNGNFLGSVLDGGEDIGELFFTCAPRIVKAFNDNNFLNGWCFLKKNSSDLIRGHDWTIKPLEDKPPITRAPGTSSSYYDYAFGQAGFDLHYERELNRLLLGAPGIKNWNGAFISMMARETRDNPLIIPKRTAPYRSEDFSYMGYAITSARMGTRPQIMSYVVGAPRGSNLLGTVKIFTPDGKELSALKGQEIGSYYGSALLAVDSNNDGSDDILVGAPMGAGTTWEEGYVYFYKTVAAKLRSHVKLVGNKKAGARFGTSIASLGDIDVDNYNDIAISAPYEDDGVGAVYIYMGSKTDLAIGAYKSSQVFVIKTLSVINYKLALDTNLTSISSSGMKVTYCIYYTQNSPTRDLKRLQFKIDVRLDYRVEDATHREFTLDARLLEMSCDSFDVRVKQSPIDLTPFKLSLTSKIVQPDIIGKGESPIEKSIPYVHACGDDNICQTQVLVNALSNLPHIVLGLNKEMIVTVSAENSGELGYDCKLHMNFSNVLELRDIRDCNLENSTYICTFASRLQDTEKEIPFKFDIKLTKPKMSQIKLNFEIQCLGENVSPDASKTELTLDVLLANSPYIQGSSTPSNFYFTDENIDKDIEVSHAYRIGNTGPSPIKLDVFLALPTVKTDGMDIFNFEAKGSLNGIEVQCNPTNRTDLQKTYNVTTLLTEPINKTVIIDCFEEGVDCLFLFCDGDYLYKSTEIAEYKVKITTKPKLLASHYKKQLLKKDILAFVSSAYIFNSTTRVEGHTSTMIFSSKSKPIPLWVYIVAGVLGIILLTLLVFLLYKCHFFDRNYRDKLNDEKLMDERMDGDADNMDPIDLHDVPDE